jgi:hypothetical protein
MADARPDDTRLRARKSKQQKGRTDNHAPAHITAGQSL